MIINNITISLNFTASLNYYYNVKIISLKEAVKDQDDKFDYIKYIVK